MPYIITLLFVLPFLFHWSPFSSPAQFHYQHFMADNHHLILKLHQTFLNCFTPFFNKSLIYKHKSISFTFLFSILQWIPTGCKKDQSNYNDLWGPKIYLSTILSSSAHLTADFQCVFTSRGTAGSVCIHNILLPHLKTKTSEPVSLSAKLSKSCPNKFLKCQINCTRISRVLSHFYIHQYI